VVADHTSYFANVEQVVLPIAHLILGKRLVEPQEHEWVERGMRRRSRFVIDRRIGTYVAAGTTAGLVMVQADRILGWVPPLPGALTSLVPVEIAAPAVRISILVGVPLVAVALVGTAWRLELGLRVLFELRRLRLRVSRLTAATVVAWSGAAVACIGLTPRPDPLAPLAVERATARVQAMAAGLPGPAARRDTAR
jgi:hypothetical protein